MFRLSLILIPFGGILLATQAQEGGKDVHAKNAWLYDNKAFVMPRTIKKDKFDAVHDGMTLGEMVKLLGKAWMRPKSSMIFDIFWGCEDGRVIRVGVNRFEKDEKVTVSGDAEMGSSLTMARADKAGKVIEVIKLPVRRDPAEMDFEFHKNVAPSRRKIELTPSTKVIKTKNGLVLGLKIENTSIDEITMTLAREWHGGEWPLTGLYASVTAEKEKKPGQFMPVYLAGEDRDAKSDAFLNSGASAELELRMDWPGTGSVPATPLIKAPGKYSVRLVLVFEISGKRQYVMTAPKVVELPEK